MTLMFEIEAVAATGVFQWVGAADEKHGIVDIMFLAEFSSSW